MEKDLDQAYEEVDRYRSGSFSCRAETEDKRLFAGKAEPCVEFIPVSATLQVRVAKVENGCITGEFVSENVAIYHPFTQAPALVSKVVSQIKEQYNGKVS